MRRVAAIILAVAVSITASAPAQAQTANPPTGFVIDIRAVTSSLPKGAGFLPPIPAGTFIPGRGFGLDVGAHLYVATLGPSRIGVGFDALAVRATATTPEPIAAGSGRPGATVIPTVIPTVVRAPDITETLTTVVPQVSFNFGSRAGWSYLTTGVGAGGVVGKAVATGGAEARQSSETLIVVMYGGGARWFLRDRLAVGFDLRFQRLGSSSVTDGVTLTAASIGMSIR